MKLKSAKDRKLPSSAPKPKKAAAKKGAPAKAAPKPPVSFIIAYHRLVTFGLI